MGESNLLRQNIYICYLLIARYRDEIPVFLIFDMVVQNNQEFRLYI